MKNPILLLVIIIALGICFYIFNQSGNSLFQINAPDNGSEDGGENTAQGGCYVGGCSGQICSDEEGVVSTCEWQESYACYQGATCERQPSGECGWTPTEALQMCLNNAQ